MKLPQLKIGHLDVDLPIIQGGMAVSVSTSELACAVAEEGGVGVIGGTGLSMEDLSRQLREARAMTKGLLALNIMVAARSFKDAVYEALRQKVDVIIAGAGFSKDVFGICREWKTPLITMVSSVKVAKLAERLGASAVVVEGRDAGGHLGTEEKTESLLPAICNAVSIPVIAAGGFVNGKDVGRVVEMGAAGVQMGTRFLLSSDCTVHDNFKQLLMKSKISDLVRILSPVGLPANAIKTPLVEKLLAGDQSIRPERCTGCLKKCSGSFCILEALRRARDGDYERGLFFTGSNFPAINKILSVKEIIHDLIEDARSYLAGDEGQAVS
ncbi:MAG: nitronate monooxygenase [Deltaproteobacteria bacterium]|nr:nitronate monooxygenase [Candidatus Anaeroferrophillus wilburensis]MBN2890003.1 nitronate monooxygenase [Deltaproteobacteria bacterium]